MRKQEFLDALTLKLSGLPKQDIEDRLNFYSEMIDDRIEEGCTEEDAVLDIGCVDEVASQIIAEIPLIKIAKERIKPKRRFKTWEIILLALGSPIWFSLGISAFAVILSLYASLWAGIISLWAVFASFAACAFCGVTVGIFFAIGYSGITGIAVIGAGIFLAGLSIFAFFACKLATKGALLLAKSIALGIKKLFVGRKCHDE